MRRGSNLPAVGTYNQTLVLDLIRRAPDGLSRVELAERTGLSAQTLTNVTRRLVDEGFIVEAGKVISGPGKPRTILALNPQSRYAVGVHLDPSVDTFVVVDVGGNIVAHAEQAPQQSIDADEIVGGIAKAVLDILRRTEIPEDRVLGIGVATPGPLDVEAGRLLDPPLLPSWHNVPVQSSLGAATGLPVVVEKDVTAAMIGEMWLDPDDDLTDAMFLYYGAGVGAGLSIAGVPVRGTTSNAGNIAHLITDPASPLCECGLRGCLGVSIEPDRLLREAHGDITIENTRAGLDDLCEAALTGDPTAQRVLQTAADRMGRAVIEVNNLLDLGTIVAGGPVWARLAPYLAGELAVRIAEQPAVTTTHIPRFRESRLGTDVAAVGAACLLLDRAFTARATNLLIEP